MTADRTESLRRQATGILSQDGEVLRQLLKRGREKDFTATGKDWATRLARGSREHHMAVPDGCELGAF